MHFTDCKTHQPKTKQSDKSNFIQQLKYNAYQSTRPGTTVPIMLHQLIVYQSQTKTFGQIFECCVPQVSKTTRIELTSKSKFVLVPKKNSK